MSTITKSVDVDADVTSIYNQWTQFTEFPKFMEGVDRIEQVDDTHTAGRSATRRFDATITEQHPDERLAWRSGLGPEHAGVVTVHRLDVDRTRVTVQMDIDLDGFVENVADKLGILDHPCRATSTGSRRSSNSAAAPRPAPGAATSTVPGSLTAWT